MSSRRPLPRRNPLGWNAHALWPCELVGDECSRNNWENCVKERFDKNFPEIKRWCTTALETLKEYDPKLDELRDKHRTGTGLQTHLNEVARQQLAGEEGREYDNSLNVKKAEKDGAWSCSDTASSFSRIVCCLTGIARTTPNKPNTFAADLFLSLPRENPDQARILKNFISGGDHDNDNAKRATTFIREYMDTFDFTQIPHFRACVKKLTPHLDLKASKEPNRAEMANLCVHNVTNEKLREKLRNYALEAFTSFNAFKQRQPKRVRSPGS